MELQEAIEALSKGSAEAFQILYKKYREGIYRFCLRMLGSESEAKDAFQDTFVKVYEHREEFYGKHFSSWIFTIARNICLNMIRARREHDSFNEVFHAKKMPKYTDVGLKRYIDSAIQQLPEKLREAFILREYEECSYKEIADILDVDLSLAKVRVYRARKQLRKILKPVRKELDELR